MGRVLPVVGIGLVANAFGAAFVPFSGKQALRNVDGSHWRLEYRDEGALIGYNGTTQLRAPYEVPVKQSILEPLLDQRRSDTVDMSYYQSSYQGLTRPSKAGLGLAILLAAGMVAASPAVDTSFLTSELDIVLQRVSEMDILSLLKTDGLPTAWLATVQSDVLPFFDEKFHSMLPDFAPTGVTVEQMLEAARTEALNYQSSTASAIDQWQATVAEQSIKFQGDFGVFMEQVSAKATTWQDIVATETASLQSQLSASLQKMDAVISSEVSSAQSGVAQLQNEVASRATATAENIVLQSFKLQDSIAERTAQLLSAADARAIEIQAAVAAPLEQATAQLKSSMETFQQVADGTMIREGPPIGAKVAAATAQAHAIYDWGLATIDRTVVSPLAEGMVLLEKASEVQTARYIADTHQSALELNLRIQDVCNEKVAEFRNEIVPETSRSLATFYSGAKAFVSEGIQWAFVKVSAWNAKAAEFQSEVSNALQQCEASLTSQVVENNREFSQLREEVATKGVEAVNDMMLGASMLRDSITELAVQQKSAAEARAIETQAAVAAPLEQATAQLKSSMETFQQVADGTMIREGPPIGAKVAAATAQAHAIYDWGLATIDRTVVSPLAEGMVLLEKASEVQTARYIADTHQSALELNLRIQDVCNEKVAEFRNEIVPETSRSLATFYSGAKAFVSEGIQWAFVKVSAWNAKAAEFQSEVSNALQQCEASLTSQVVENNREFSQLREEVATKGVEAVNDMMLGASMLRDSITELAVQQKSAAEARAIEIQAAVAAPLEQATAQLKSSMETFQQVADGTMIREGPPIGAKVAAATAQAHAIYDWGLATIDRTVVSPLAEGMVSLEKASEVQTARYIADTHQSALELNLRIQDVCNEKVAEFRNEIVPQVSRDLAAIYSDAKLTAAEVRYVGIPRLLTTVEASIFGAATNLLAEGTKLQASLSTFGFEVKDSIDLHYAQLHNELVPEAKQAIATWSSNARDECAEMERAAAQAFATAKDSTEATVSQFQVSATTVSKQASEAASNVADRMQTEVLSKLRSSASAAASTLHDEIVTQSTTWKESVSSRLVDLAHSSSDSLLQGTQKAQELPVAKVPSIKMAVEANAIDMSSHDVSASVKASETTVSERLNLQYDRLLNKLSSS